MSSVMNMSDSVYKLYLENVLNYRSVVLKTKNISLNKLRNSSKLRIKSLKEQISSLMNDLNMENLRYDELLQEHMTMITEKDLKLEEYEESLMVCKSELTELNRNHQITLLELNIFKNKLNSEKKLYKHCIDIKQQNLTNSMHENVELEKRIEKQNAIISALTVECMDLKHEIEQNKIENDNLLQNNNALLTEKNELIEQLEIFNAQICCELDASQKSVSNSQMKDLQNNLTSLQEEKKKLVVKNSNYEKTINYLRDQLKIQNDWINSHKINHQENKTNISVENQSDIKLGKENELLAFYRNKLTVQETQNSELLYQLLNHENNISQLESLIKEKERQICDASNEKSKLRSEIDNAVFISENSFKKFSAIILDICKCAAIKYNDSILKNYTSRSNDQIVVLMDNIGKINKLVDLLKEKYDTLKSKNKNLSPSKKLKNASIRNYLMETPDTPPLKTNKINDNSLNNSFIDVDDVYEGYGNDNEPSTSGTDAHVIASSSVNHSQTCENNPSSSLAIPRIKLRTQLFKSVEHLTPEKQTISETKQNSSSTTFRKVISKTQTSTRVVPSKHKSDDDPEDNIDKNKSCRVQ